MLRLIRFITLIALALLPLGMAPATAAHDRHQMVAYMPMDDCSGDGPQQYEGSGIGQCAMPCASALAPTTVPVDQMPPQYRDHGLPGTSNRLHGLVLEIATPPPRLS